MKKLVTVLVLIGLCITGYGQVGINTTKPTSTLDVNGTIRMRGTTVEQSNNTIATSIVGLDDEGNFVQVQIDENLVLENNRIRATNRILEIGDIPALNVAIIHNLDLVIWPGDPNEDKSVIRISNILGDIFITGLVAGQDGQQIWLYPVSGQITFLPNSILSLFSNQIENNDDLVVKRYEMAKLMYDATRSKWIIMGH